MKVNGCFTWGLLTIESLNACVVYVYITGVESFITRLPDTKDDQNVVMKNNLCHSVFLKCERNIKNS